MSMRLIVLMALLAFQGNLTAETIVERGTSELFRLDPTGKLVFTKDAKGNCLLERAIPYVPVKKTLEPSPGDDTQRIQGPNVFVDCVGFKSKSSAGPHHRYSVGTLFDNVKSEKPMESRFRGDSGTGHGWAGTQTCFYHCVAPGFNVEAPPGGISWVIGSATGDEEGTGVAPSSLYYQQVQDRLGNAALDRLATEEHRKHIGEYHWVEERLKNENGSK